MSAARDGAAGERLASTRAGGAVELRRSAERFTTRTGWLDSRHSFSFSHHYDPANTHHGLLLVSNDDTVRPGTGFDTHPHRDMEIVTWVLRGSLVHQDSEGNAGVIYPGLAQRMSAGTGIFHSERNDAWRAIPGAARDEPVRFVQMWVVPDEAHRAPGYEQAEIHGELLAGGLVPVASGLAAHGDAAIRIGNRHAALHAARLEPGATVELPDAPFVHLYVPIGAASLEGAGRLDAGDAARLTGAGPRRVVAHEPTELLAWEMHAKITA